MDNEYEIKKIHRRKVFASIDSNINIKLTDFKQNVIFFFEMSNNRWRFRVAKNSNTFLQILSS
jgi:hypothetical protein